MNGNGKNPGVPVSVVVIGVGTWNTSLKFYSDTSGAYCCRDPDLARICIRALLAGACGNQRALRIPRAWA